MSPLFPKLASESAVRGDSSTHFKRDLLQYLAAYKARQLTEWQQIICEHDMSAAKWEATLYLPLYLGFNLQRVCVGKMPFANDRFGGAYHCHHMVETAPPEEALSEYIWFYCEAQVSSLLYHVTLFFH